MLRWTEWYLNHSQSGHTDCAKIRTLPRLHIGQLFSGLSGHVCDRDRTWENECYRSHFTDMADLHSFRSLACSWFCYTDVYCFWWWWRHFYMLFRAKLFFCSTVNTNGSVWAPFSACVKGRSLNGLVISDHSNETWMTVACTLFFKS